MALTGLLLSIIISLCVCYFIYLVIKHRRYCLLCLKLPGAELSLYFKNIVRAVSSNYDEVKFIKAVTNGYKNYDLYSAWRGADLLVFISEPEYQKIYCNHKGLSKRNDMYDFTNAIIGQQNVLSGEYEPWKKARKELVHILNAMNPNTWTTTMVKAAEGFAVDMRKYSNVEWVQCKGLIARMGNKFFAGITFNENIEEEKELLEALVDPFVLLRGIVLRTISPKHFFNMSYPWTDNCRENKNLCGSIRDGLARIITKEKKYYHELVKEGAKIPNIYLFIIFERYPDLTIEEVINVVTSLFLAGVDTTVGGLAYTLIMIALHPEVQERVFFEDAEIQATLQGRELEFKDLSEYKYLDRVIMETLRMYPAFAVIGRVAREDITFGNHLVPSGATVLSSIYWAHRRDDLFPEPLRFNPDRFLPENMKTMHPYQYMPFGAGPKNCIGSKFASMFIKIVCSTMVRNYKIYTHYTNIDQVDENAVSNVTILDGNKARLRFERRVPL